MVSIFKKGVNGFFNLIWKRVSFSALNGWLLSIISLKIQAPSEALVGLMIRMKEYSKSDAVTSLLEVLKTG
jgi:hypothetical protein